jgi:hypothetical protein
MTSDPLDDRFAGCAFAAFIEVWRETGIFPPDSETVRKRAYRYYEEELAKRRADKSAN